MTFQLIDNGLKAEDYIYLRSEVGFMKTPLDQTEQSLKNGLFSVVAECDGKNVGMGRLVGDGVMYWYIQDVAVLPEYQGKGIGKAIVQKLMQYVEENSIPGTYTTIGLMAAKGKDTFYEKLGFISRPNDTCGAGMMKRFLVGNKEEEQQWNYGMYMTLIEIKQIEQW